MNKSNLKKRINKRAVALALAGTVAFSNAPVLEVSALSNEAPTVTYEQFEKMNYVKIFINGRLVEFNDSLGYPYIENGRTMIPLRAVAETFNAVVKYLPSYNVAEVQKANQIVDVKINSNMILYTDQNKEETLIHTDAIATIRNDRTYIPLRAVFELFGMDVRWDAENNTAHIESYYHEFENIDFKDKKFVYIEKATNYNKIIYDGKEISKDYLNILKYTDQYKAYIENNTLYIYSFQYLYDLNYIYGKLKSIKNDFNKTGVGEERLTALSNEEHLLFIGMLKTGAYVNSWEYTPFETKQRDNFYYCIAEDDTYVPAYEKLVEMANEIKKQTSNKTEQIKLANNKICSITDYDISALSINKLVNEGKGNCTPYAKAFAIMMDSLDIPCFYIMGTRYGEGHAWDCVFVDGKWKFVDVTYNDTTNNLYLLTDIEETNKEYNYVMDEDIAAAIEVMELTYKF